MLIRRPRDIAPSEITPERTYLDRRKFIQKTGRGLALAAVAPGVVSAACERAEARRASANASREGGRAVADLQEELTSFEDITHYNNYYEFGPGKQDPWRNSGEFQPHPWTIAVTGHCEKPGSYGLEDFIKPFEIEERVYRMRCVEAWSMVIPWLGFPLSRIIDRAQPTSNARYIAFTTVFRPSEMPAQNTGLLDWPYREGLRMDEAMHPLTILSTGLYGKELLNQNGAPLRLVVPWKYGFKSIKSIVKIEFVEEMPYNTWNGMAPQEYGFYANVNPDVDHPRWSQARERRIGNFFKRPTLMFNGYADQVAHLYEGMDLAKWY